MKAKNIPMYYCPDTRFNNLYTTSLFPLIMKRIRYGIGFYDLIKKNAEPKNLILTKPAKAHFRQFIESFSLSYTIAKKAGSLREFIQFYFITLMLRTLWDLGVLYGQITYPLRYRGVK